MDRRERQELLNEISKQGFAIRDLDLRPAKVTYYKPNGEALPNLPADPYSMRRYLRRGFTLTPPIKPPDGNNGEEGESNKEE